MSKDKKTILIVEDELPVLMALSAKCEKAGLNIIKAQDGEEGLAAALDKHPDLVILDIIMPKMDGMTLMKKIRGDDWGKNVPIIMLTNLSDPKSVSEAAEHKVYDFLVKTDWQLGDIIKLIKEKLYIE